MNDPIMEAIIRVLQAKWEYILKGVELSLDPDIFCIVIKHLDAIAVEARDCCQDKIDQRTTMN